MNVGWVTTLCFVLLCCQSGSKSQPVPALAKTPVPILPYTDGPFAPALTQLESYHPPQLTATKSCTSCHQDVASAFSSSAHAFASFNNPIYRASVMRLRLERGFEVSRMCGGCHDPALLVEDLMDEAIDFNSEKSNTGVSCRVCHGIKNASSEGNGSYTISSSPIPLPKTGDMNSIQAHRDGARPLGNDMCASCHRSVLSKHTGNASFLSGADDWGAWQSSAYASQGVERLDNVSPQNCIDCHMPYEQAQLGDAAAKNGFIRSHRFSGGHTFLAALTSNHDALVAHQKQLKDVIRIDIAALNIQQPIKTDEENGFNTTGKHIIKVDIVLTNEKVGHRFPGGTTDAQNTWIELEILDAAKRVLLSAGHQHRNGENDPSAHVLTSYVADDHGNLVNDRATHDFVAHIADHTIAPRDAIVVRYHGDLPETFSSPLTVQARIVHRSRNSDVHKLSCITKYDYCIPQPTTIVASTERAADNLHKNETSLRYYNHGRALLHDVQDYVETARESLHKALALALVPFEKAQIEYALGQLESRLGRTERAMNHFTRAKKLTGEDAAIDMARGLAFARVWAWQDAVDAFSKSAKHAPKNLGAWRELSMSLGSLGEHNEALRAAQKGLELNPNDSDLLRVQALALKSLSSPHAEEALELYETRQVDDRTNEIRAACAKKNNRCRLEQKPVHTHELSPPR